MNKNENKKVKLLNTLELLCHHLFTRWFRFCVN